MVLTVFLTITTPTKRVLRRTGCLSYMMFSPWYVRGEFPRTTSSPEPFSPPSGASGSSCDVAFPFPFPAVPFASVPAFPACVCQQGPF